MAYLTVSYRKLNLKSTVTDIMSAAGLVAGFDISATSSPYHDSTVTEGEESERLLSDDEVGIYDPDTGKITLNEKAESDKKTRLCSRKKCS